MIGLDVGAGGEAGRGDYPRHLLPILAEEDLSHCHPNYMLAIMESFEQ